MTCHQPPHGDSASLRSCRCTDPDSLRRSGLTQSKIVGALTSPLDVIFKPITLRGFYMGHPEYAAKIPPTLKQAAAMIASGLVHISVSAIYPLSSIKEAVAHALRGGKVLLDVAGSSALPR